jgi:mRNA interferase MazF
MERVMERGEIRWYKFKPPDKERSVVVLTRDAAIQFLGEVTVAPITSTIRGIPTEVILNESDGMKTSCAINLDHVQTVAKSKLGALITKLPEAKMEQVKPALLFAFGFDD